MGSVNLRLFSVLGLVVSFSLSGCERKEDVYELAEKSGYDSGYASGVGSRSSFEEGYSNGEIEGAAQASQDLAVGKGWRIYVAPFLFSLLGGIAFGIVVQYALLYYSRTAKKLPPGLMVACVPGFHGSEAYKFVQKYMKMEQEHVETEHKRDLALKQKLMAERRRQKLTQQKVESAQSLKELYSRKIVQLLSSEADSIDGKKDLVVAAMACGNLSEFLRLLHESELTSVLENNGPYTVFAPTDDAFQRYRSRNGNANEQTTETLRSLIASHIFKGRIATNLIGTGTKTLKPNDGRILQLAIVNGKLAIAKPDCNVVAAAISLDLPARNGLIHTIDEVLA